ncbi:MAG TPA: NAD(P)H-binding protein [Myxococcaceae bacterium]|nr:NAD(P)H-binding protein [Myxococcaceae bacterium]
MNPRRLFVAGSTGATGRLVVNLAASQAIPCVAHVRPRPGRIPGPGQAVFELSDRQALVSALRGCTTVLQLIGTMRSRFVSGDTYQTSDVGTTRDLVEAAREAGVDHVVLLSSVGAGRPVGAYLQAKAAAEDLVRGAGISWTIFRPSVFIGEGRRPPPGFASLTRLLGLRRFEPIPLDTLARGLLRSAAERAPLETVLEGESLWAWCSDRGVVSTARWQRPKRDGAHE